MPKINSMKNLTIIPVIFLFIWISFFPQPIQDQCRLATNIFLGIAFICLLIVKRGNIFRVSDWPLWFFILTLGINVIFADDQNVAVRTYLNLSIPLVIIYYLVGKGASFDTRLNLLAKVICLSSIIVAIIGIFEIIFKKQLTKFESP